MSDIISIIDHPAYQKIVGLGDDAIPFLLADLGRKPYDWFPALTIIAKENPVPKKFSGNVSEMARYWKEWGKKQGYMS